MAVIYWWPHNIKSADIKPSKCAESSLPLCFKYNCSYEYLLCLCRRLTKYSTLTVFTWLSSEKIKEGNEPKFVVNTLSVKKSWLLNLNWTESFKNISVYILHCCIFWLTSDFRSEKHNLRLKFWGMNVLLILLYFLL